MRRRADSLVSLGARPSHSWWRGRIDQASGARCAPITHSPLLSARSAEPSPTAGTWPAPLRIVGGFCPGVGKLVRRGVAGASLAAQPAATRCRRCHVWSFSNVTRLRRLLKRHDVRRGPRPAEPRQALVVDRGGCVRRRLREPSRRARLASRLAESRSWGSHECARRAGPLLVRRAPGHLRQCEACYCPLSVPSQECCALSP